MPPGLITPVRAGATNVLELQGLRDVLAAAGVYIDTAAVEVTIAEYLSGAAVLTSTVVPAVGSEGDYRVSLPADVGFRPGVRYTATITAAATVGAEDLAYLETMELVGATQ